LEKQITIGITGGIGAGKSTVCSIINILGYPVFYSDQAAKNILQTNQDVQSKLISLLGNETYQDGQLNRVYVASIIFSNPSILSEMNSIVHPAVRIAFSNWCKAQKSELVFNEAAILFETGAYKNFDYTVLVTCPQEIRLNRVIKRDASKKQDVLDRMNQQWTDQQKLQLADFEIKNDDQKLIIPQVIDLLKELQ
jgi:dephospho-CoA kinase